MRDDYKILKKITLKNGKELILRKPVEQDCKEIIGFLNTVGGESDNLLYGENGFTFTVEDEKKYIDSINNDENCLMILGIIDDRIISISNISSLNGKRFKHNSSFGIAVKKEFWRMGIGSIAMSELIKFARENKVIQNISLGVKADNYGAIKLYENHGFKKVGVHKNYFNVGGKYFDEVLMDLYLS